MTSSKEPPKALCLWDLPPEIRSKIWKFCLPEGRILPFKVTADSVHNNYNMYSFRHLPPPNVLHLCCESREETKKCFRKDIWDDVADEHGARNKHAWWIPSRDTIYVPYWLPLNCLDSNVTVCWTTDARQPDLSLVRRNPEFQYRMQAVQHLACSMNACCVRWDWYKYVRCRNEDWSWILMAKWISGFPNLRTFTWIIDYTEYRYTKEGPEWIDHPDFPIEGIWRDHASRWDMTPSKIMLGFQECFEVIKYEKNETNWKPPKIRIALDKMDKMQCEKREERYRKQHPHGPQLSQSQGLQVVQVMRSVMDMEGGSVQI